MTPCKDNKCVRLPMSPCRTRRSLSSYSHRNLHTRSSSSRSSTRPTRIELQCSLSLQSKSNLVKVKMTFKFNSRLPVFRMPVSSKTAQQAMSSTFNSSLVHDQVHSSINFSKRGDTNRVSGSGSLLPPIR